MAKVFAICQGCDCHVRLAERTCPHCGADVAVAGGARSPRRRSIEAGRVFLATALAGIGVACSGSSVPLPAQATEQDLRGACAGDAYPDAFGKCGSTAGSCTCGPAGRCVEGSCDPKLCDLNVDYLDRAGECVPLPSCPSGQVAEGPSCSPADHTCYGAPPLLG